MILVVDESVDREVVDHLRQQGHSITYIAETEPSLEDDFVLSQAVSKNAVLLTADKDFGELIYRKGQVSSGIILLRLPQMTPTQRASLIGQVINTHAESLHNAFCVINEKRVRLRKF
jgi:predicted nuclease of predicted toxin-antitoxin system